MSNKTKFVIFLIVCVALTLTPVTIMLLNANWVWPMRDISVALAFLGMSIVGMQFLPISRMP